MKSKTGNNSLLSKKSVNPRICFSPFPVRSRSSMQNNYLFDEVADSAYPRSGIRDTVLFPAVAFPFTIILSGEYMTYTSVDGTLTNSPFDCSSRSPSMKLSTPSSSVRQRHIFPADFSVSENRLRRKSDMIFSTSFPISFCSLCYLSAYVSCSEPLSNEFRVLLTHDSSPFREHSYIPLFVARITFSLANLRSMTESFMVGDCSCID